MIIEIYKFDFLSHKSKMVSEDKLYKKKIYYEDKCYVDVEFVSNGIIVYKNSYFEDCIFNDTDMGNYRIFIKCNFVNCKYNYDNIYYKCSFM